MSSIWTELLNNILATSWQEWVSTLLQITSVWFAMKNNVWVYPTGIIGVLLASYIYLFMNHPPLYGESALNFYYFIMSIYGWRQWTRKKNEQIMYPVSWCSKIELLNGLFVFWGCWLMIYLILSKLTNSNTPLLDAFVSASAVSSMWWMAKRKMENWIAWVISNLAAIPLNYSKNLMLFSLMYILFLGMAVSGFFSWKKMLRNVHA
jgi:nicotinamide mononucleotide transporter